MSTGIVYLVGAGPGDPDLITVKGARLLRECDAVVYDRLVHPSLIPDASQKELHYAGKKDGEDNSVAQQDINALLVRLAREDKQVVRLKGGDPFVFGRGGEEALALAEAGIPFEVVPGISSGVAAPAYAGIPVTHRSVSPAVTFVTANHDPARINPPLDWEALGKTQGTLVIFMGAKTFPNVAPYLMRGGLSPDTPAAAIEWGTYAEKQRTVTATLATLARAMDEEEFGAPVSIIIGDVVTLRHRIAWFESSHPEQREGSAVEGEMQIPRDARNDSAPRTTGILLIDHGSRIHEANEMLNAVAALVEHASRNPVVVCPAHMELAEPTIAQGFANCVARGAAEVVAVPYMLSPGRHSTQDIPRLVGEAAAEFPHIAWRVAAALGIDERLAETVLDRAAAVIPSEARKRSEGERIASLRALNLQEDSGFLVHGVHSE